MKLYQANLGRGVSRQVFEKNLELVLKSATPNGVVFFQEIDEADEPDEMAEIKRRVSATHNIVGAGTSVPILVPKRFDILSERITPACRGLAKFTPHRVVTEATVRIKPGLRVSLYNTHLPIDRMATSSRRKAVRDALRRRVNHDANPGVWASDTNTHGKFPRMHPRERSVINAGIDKVRAWGNKEWELIVVDIWHDELTIDNHSGHGAQLRWRKRTP